MASLAFNTLGAGQTTTPQTRVKPVAPTPYETALAGLPSSLRSAPPVAPKPVATNSYGYGRDASGNFTYTPPKVSKPTAGLLSQTKPATPAPTIASTQPINPPLPQANQNAGMVAPKTDQASYPTNPPPTFSGLVSQIPQSAQGQGPVNPAAKAASDRVAEIEKNIGELRSHLGTNQAGYLTGGLTTPVAMGRAQVLGQTEAAQEQGLGIEQQAAQDQLKNELATQQQGTAGLTTAAGLIAPQLAGFNQQSFNPATGQFGGGTQGATALSQLPPQAQTAIKSYAQQVQAGQMTRADAESRLSAYGVAGTNALNEALGPSFNTNASNASAQTTAIGQQVQTYAQSANAALDKLTTDFGGLPAWQKLGIPGTIGIEQGIGQFFGNDKLATYLTTLHDARAQLTGVLSTAGGMTPTSAEDTAKTYLPDNMTADQLASKIEAAKSLVQQKVQAFTQSGQQNQPQNTGAQGIKFNQDGTLQAVSF